jgi:hypothetical protein
MSLWAPLCWTNSNSEFNFSGEISQQWTDSAWLPLCSQPTFQYRSLLPPSEWISTSISPLFFNRHCKMGSVIIWEGLPPCHWMLDGRTLYRTDFCYYFMKSTVRLLYKSLTKFLWVSLLSSNCTEKTPPPFAPPVITPINYLHVAMILEEDIWMTIAIQCTYTVNVLLKGTHARDFHSLFLNLILHLSNTKRYKTQYNQHFRKSSSNSPRYSKFSITHQFPRKRKA